MASPVTSPAVTSGTSSSAPQWKETKTPEGRIYWYNTTTRQSTWKKPEELWTEEEKAIDACPWKEYTSPDGKKYYSHKETKQTTWKVPEEYQELVDTLERIKQTEKTTTAPVTPPVATPPTLPQQPPQPMPYTPSPPVYNRPSSAVSLLLSQPPDIIVDSPEKAMEEFHLLLKSKGVTTDWDWEETMRAIITDPRYRVFKTTGERKAAFQAYINLEAKRKREEKEAQEKKERQDFYAMLDANPKVKPYSSYRTVAPLLVSEPAFQHIASDRQRQTLFHDYTHHVRRLEKEQAKKLKKTSMAHFRAALDRIEVKDHSEIPLWKDIYQQYVMGGNNQSYDGMTPADFIEVFQEYHQKAWEHPLAIYHKRMEQQQHQDRLTRDGFKQLLGSLRQEGAINAFTQWKEIYPRVADDARYTNLLGVPSSTPLDLFWDLVDDLDRDLYDQRKKVQEYLKQHDEKVTLETTMEDYQSLLDAHPALRDQLDPVNIPLIYKEIQGKELRKHQEQLKKQHRKTQKRIKALRDAIRYLDNPPLKPSDTWDAIEPRLKDTEVYMDLEQDQPSQLEAFQQALAKIETKEDDDDEDDEDDDEEGIIKDR